ncbi:MAG: single-stranded-DNA-specific exonuclease RecJ, partial [Vicinamibacteria bacterium]
AVAAELRRHVWGQGFAEPRFAGRFSVEGHRVVGGSHSRLTLGLDGRRYVAMRFGEAGPFPAAIDVVYRLDVNDFNGTESLQLMIDHWAGSGPRPV